MTDTPQPQSHSTPQKINKLPKFQYDAYSLGDLEILSMRKIISKRLAYYDSFRSFRDVSKRRKVKELLQNLQYITFFKRLRLGFRTLFNKNSFSFGRGMMMLSDSFKKMTISQSLRIQFEKQAFNAHTLKELGRCLKHLTSLKKLDLSFYICEISDTKDFKYLRKALRSLPCLKHFGLSFESAKCHNKERFAGIIQNFQHLSCFKELTFHFSENTREEKRGLPDFCASLRNLTSLERLNLGLLNCDEISSEVALSLSESLKCLTSLKSLKLYLSSCVRNENEDLLALGLAFRYLHCLETIDLNLEKYFLYLDDETLETFSQNWKNLPKLQNFTLNISSGHEVTDEGLKGLLDNLNSQHQLKNLTLVLSPEKLLGEAGMKYLSDFFIANPQLETFDICSSQNQNISKAGLEILAQGTKNLNNLKALRIDFTKSPMTNEGFESIAESFQYLSSLQSLGLNFRNCSDLDDNSLNSFIKNIQNLNSLKVLNIDFSLAGCLTDNGLKSLSAGLRNLWALERADLRLGSRDNTNITIEGVNLVVQSLKKLNLLHYLYFSIHSEGLTLPKEEVAKLKRELKHISTVTFYIYGKS